MKCKNCGNIIKGNFCHHCGQNSKVGEINLSNFINELSDSVFQINRGLFYTFKELLVRPGLSIKEFLNGKRKNHFKPVAYVLLLSTVYLLISRIAEQSTMIDEIFYGFNSFDTGSGTKSEIPSYLTWFSVNYAYTNLLLLPIFSFASFLSFWGSGRNYLEHIVLNAYITGQKAIFYSIFILLGIFIDSNILEGISLILSLAYTFWVFWQFFTKGNRAINIFRSILTYILYLVFGSGLLYFLWH